MQQQRASVVATDGTVTDGTYPEAIGGFSIIEVPTREEALQWAAKVAAACRCAQEVGSSSPTPNRPRCSARRTGDGDLQATSDQC